MLNVHYSLSKHSHVLSTSTLILHFYLAGLASKSLAPHVLEMTLREYLAPDSLRLIEESYDFTDYIDDHISNVSKWLGDVRSVQKFA